MFYISWNISSSLTYFLVLETQAEINLYIHYPYVYTYTHIYVRVYIYTKKLGLKQGDEAPLYG